MRIVALIQARLGSSRLPGKVLKDIAGKPMLLRVVERVRLANLVTHVVVATTDAEQDDEIALFCETAGIDFYRGSQFDVLDRFYQAAKHFEADVIVRITADCPVIDPGLIDETVETLINHGLDFAANRLPPPWHRTYPIGLDVEACTMSALERAWHEAALPFEREHVMPYFYDQEGRFNVAVLNTDPDYGHLRWTVDTPDDLSLLHAMYSHLNQLESFDWLDILALVQSHPELQHMNENVNARQTFEVDDRSQLK